MKAATAPPLDDFGRQINLIDGSGNKTIFVYDAPGREIQTVDPNGSTSVSFVPFS